jgi:8-oxo-dGTP diphosphatase
MKREYPLHPIVGVGAIVLERDAVLLARRGKDPGKGLWSLPGGAVELGETLMEALARETREELSVDIEVGGLVDVYDRIFPDRANRVRYHYVLVDYWGRIASGSPAAGSDISEVGWFPLESLSSLNVGRTLEEAVCKAARLRDRKTSKE